MRPPHHILDRKQVHRLAAEHLQAHLKFKDYKRKTSAQVLWSLLLAAAARITSLSDACQRLDDAPSDETARKALLATLPEYAVLQRQLNAALAGHLPKVLRKQLQRLAIDLTLIPYHGKPFRDLNEIYRGQAKSGTSHFHAYATAYVVRKGQRYTVALTGVKKGESLKDVVQRLLRQAAECGHPAPAAPVGSRLLQRGGDPLPPGGAVSVPDAGGLPRPLSQATRAAPAAAMSSGPGRRAVGPTYTLADAKKRTATVSICVKCRNYRGQWKRHGRQALIYAYWGYRPPSPDSVFTTYRLRFGIESSYRQMHEGRIRTTTRRPDGAAVVRGDRAGAAEPLGVAALHDPVDAAPWRAGDPAGAAAVGDAAAVVAPCGREGVRGRRCHLHRKGCGI